MFASFLTKKLTGHEYKGSIHAFGENILHVKPAQTIVDKIF